MPYKNQKQKEITDKGTAKGKRLCDKPPPELYCY